MPTCGLPRARVWSGPDGRGGGGWGPESRGMRRSAGGFARSPTRGRASAGGSGRGSSAGRPECLAHPNARALGPLCAPPAHPPHGPARRRRTGGVPPPLPQSTAFRDAHTPPSPSPQPRRRCPPPQPSSRVTPLRPRRMPPQPCRTPLMPRATAPTNASLRTKPRGGEGR